MTQGQQMEAGIREAPVRASVPPSGDAVATQVRDRLADSAPIKVIYICGYGRSGSTLLDIMLGQQRSMFGAGEIVGLCRHVHANDEYCACGERLSSCAFWAPVMAQWRGHHLADLAQEYGRLQTRFESIVSPARLRRNSREFRDYAHHSLRLMRLLSAASGKPVIVDSSKLPGRGLALAGMEGIDLHVVHLVRDGRGVAWSLAKPYKPDASIGLQREIIPKPLLYSAARWAYVNLASEWLCRRVGRGRYVRIRYEDMVSDPAGTLDRIATLIGIPLDPRDVESGEFQPAHQVAGNRLRMQKAIRVRHDDSWQVDMPRKKQDFITRMCRFFLTRYGYPMGVS